MSNPKNKKLFAARIKKLNMKGENCHLWKGGITPITKVIRHLVEYVSWRKTIFERDDFTCQECHNKGGKLHAHHKKPFALLIQEFLKCYSQFSPIDDKETLIRLATTHKPFWDISNGKTLCKDYHRQARSFSVS